MSHPLSEEQEEELSLCQNCGSNEYEWQATIVNGSGIQNGLLGVHDLHIVFYQYCVDCGETLQCLRADKCEIIDVEELPCT